MLDSRSRSISSPAVKTPAALAGSVLAGALVGPLALLGPLALSAQAQPGVSPDAAPAKGEIVVSPVLRATPPTPVAIPAVPDSLRTPKVAPTPTLTPTPAPGSTTTSGATTTPGGTTAPDAIDTSPSHLTAPNFHVENGGTIIVATGTPDNLVTFESSAGKIWGEDVRIDTVNHTIDAKGTVRLERTQAVQQNELRPRNLRPVTNNVNVIETAYGKNLTYNFNTQQGTLDSAQLYLANVNLSAQNIVLNGQRYTAQNIIAYPGGLTEAERKIYGTPPLNLHAKHAVIVTNPDTNVTRTSLRGAYLYYRKTKLIPLPAYSFNTSNGSSEAGATSITPGISFNSADRVLVTTRLIYPIDKKMPERLSLAGDIGVSARVGLRGGASLTSSTSVGDVALSLRHSDIVTSQLTNRIELDREPEISFSSRPLFKVDLPGGRKAGLVFDGSYGDYTERFINSGNNTHSNRLRGRLMFTTRLAPKTGAYLRLFSTYSTYSNNDQNYGNTGYEIGYDGQLLPRVRGQISYRNTNVTGATPFRFDRVEIRSEARATFDVTLTPRYLLPLDVRYDVDQGRVRDTTFGLLRSYKSFAYGVVYQTVRKDLRLEVRNAF